MADCSSCPSKGGCDKQETCNIENNPKNHIGKIIGVMSGKGGVGKSTVTVLIANHLAKLGYKVGILDSDITGPSIPRLTKTSDKKAYSDGEMIIPVKSDSGMKIISMNHMIDDENEPVIWRGPLVGGVVKQFYKDVAWGELDYLLIDMPPGTGDVALTVMQSIPLTGIVMVSVPQNLVSMIVSKAVVMAEKLDIPVIGVVENMSYIKCPKCDEKIKIFDDVETDEFLNKYKLDLLGEFPMSSEVTKLTIEGVENVSPEISSILCNVTNKIIEFKK